MNKHVEFEGTAKQPQPDRDAVLAMFPGLQQDIEFLRGLFGEVKILELKQGDQHLNTNLNIQIEHRGSLNSEQWLRLGQIGVKAKENNAKRK